MSDASGEARLPSPPRGREGGKPPPTTQVRCSVAILAAEPGDPQNVILSIETARAFGLGDLFSVVVQPLSSGDSRQMLHDAAEAAQDEGFDWLLVVGSSEMLVPDVFVKTAPALRVHDAVWGAAGVIADTPDRSAFPDSPRLGGREQNRAAIKPERITRLAAQDLPTFFHAALQWWIGRTHFVRPEAALEALRSAEGPAWYADYLVALWCQRRGYKTAQPLTLFQGRVPPVPEIERDRLIEELARHPVFMPVRHGSHPLLLPYTGINPVIEREQSRGQFFEPDELRFLEERLPRGLRIVDAGANTGNHTLFFAAVMNAATVVPIEPDPRAVAAIRATVAENRLGNVDFTCLGKALGAGSGRLRPVFSVGGGLGATRFEPDPDGEIAMEALDSLIAGPVGLLKIDVEGMEMAVLAGAEGLIARCRPGLYIEVLDAKVHDFLRWVDLHEYRIEKLFPDKAHCNYFLVPVEWP